MLITPDSHRVLADDEADDSTFPCGHCSTNAVAVYHNLFGRHRHVPREQVEEWFPVSQ